MKFENFDNYEIPIYKSPDIVMTVFHDYKQLIKVQ